MWVPMNSGKFRCGILEQVVLKIPRKKVFSIPSLKKQANFLIKLKELRFPAGARARRKLYLREGYPQSPRRDMLKRDFPGIKALGQLLRL